MFSPYISARTIKLASFYSAQGQTKMFVDTNKIIKNNLHQIEDSRDDCLQGFHNYDEHWRLEVVIYQTHVLFRQFLDIPFCF